MGKRNWSVSDNAYMADCGTPTILRCDGGYWLANATDIECEVADYGHYSPNDDLARYACASGEVTSTQTSASAADCFTCPMNSVCAPGRAIKTCDELTGGQYTKSDTGTVDVANCYKDCAVAEHATQMSGRDYYTATDTCAIVTCDAGYSLSNNKCITCPEGYFCDGTAGENGDGKKSCADLGDGSWVYATAGATNANACYRQCVQHNEDTCTMTPTNDTANWPGNCEFVGTSATGNPAEVVNGVCVETSCINTYEMINGVCHACDRANALSYEADGNCVVQSCVIGYHPNKMVIASYNLVLSDTTRTTVHAKQMSKNAQTRHHTQNMLNRSGMRHRNRTVFAQ